MPIPQENRSRRRAEEALLGLVRLINALAFYPSGHSSLQNAAREALKGFEATLGSGEPLELSVRRGELRQGDTPLGENPALRKLALHLFTRRIRTLTIRPDLRSEDLLALASCLCTEPARLQRQGGVAALLEKENVRGVEVKEADTSQRLRHSREADSGADLHEEAIEEVQPLEGEPPSQESADPLELLHTLQHEKSDHHFRQALRGLLAFIRRSLDKEHRAQVLHVVDALAVLSASSDIPDIRRKEIRAALGALATEEILRFFIQSLATPTLKEDGRRRLLRILFFYRESVAYPLMESLAEEKDPRVRRSFTEAMISLQGGALPALTRYLRDERWQVARHAVAILGEMRRPETASLLKEMTTHPDIRVRRESLRSLTRIGGGEALSLLLETAREGDTPLRLQALLSLGALRDPRAVSTLMEIAQLPDRWMKQVEVRKRAIRALGEIGAPEALPLLIALLRKRPFWRRRRADEVRAAAATALGEMPSEEGAAALERASTDPSETVARAAVQALKNFRKEGYGSGQR